MHQWDAELVVDARCLVGEGPSWDAAAGRLLWVDIQGKALHTYDPVSGSATRVALPSEPGTIVPRTGGGAVIAAEDGFALVDPFTGALEPLINPEADHPERRFNDGKCDPQGRLWAGTLCQDLDRPPDQWDPVGTLYRLDGDGACYAMLYDLIIPNGLTWSPDGSVFYFIDSPGNVVQAFDFEPRRGELSKRRVVVEIPAEVGFPDGMTSDEEGMLWIAHFFGGKVTRWNPATGEMIGLIQLPVGNVTSCVFGGADLADLYITTASLLLDEAGRQAQPEAGGVFVARPGVRGVPSHPFNG
ncbi:MAG: SMP-30/gluconolactonase/LRE family protein [Pseudomonadota bacterium]|nr:SMP-30/gluconolactonase/LRE family protein [Pseudomonadota bacterium]